ncbi:MAG: ABC transporter substrate-binding protein, partial [Terracidiphilus sp.]
MLRRSAISLLLAALALPVAARTRPHYGGTIHVETEGDPWQPGSLARRLVFDGLTAMSPEGVATPALAIDWKPENNNHRWQFRLRPGVRFQDGTPLTSINAIAALAAVCGSGCPWSGLHAVGSSVVFTADSPLPNLPELLAGDAYRLSLTVTASGATPAVTTGTGPYQVAGFANGVLSLTACDACWQGRPFADAVEIRVHRAVRDQWLDLSLGRADLAEVPAEQLRQARDQRLGLLVSPPATLVALQVSDSGPLANPNLRAAIAAAVDRSALSNVIFQKQGEVTASLLPAALTGYGFLFPAERDLGRALSLRGGLSTPLLTLSADGSGPMQLVAQRLALNLHDAGFNVQPVNASQVPRGDLVLRRIPLETAEPAAALESIVRATGPGAAVEAPTT